MDKTIRDIIVKILNSNKKLLRIPIRQRAKFEGWLKFEIANSLEQSGIKSVEVESKINNGNKRSDISFLYKTNLYNIELKTPNTNWKIKGIHSTGRPITKNIQSIIDDTIKLNSSLGIIAFVFFPIPINDSRWEIYLERISKETGLNITKEQNCEIIRINIDNTNKCEIVVCTFKSKILKKGSN